MPKTKALIKDILSSAGMSQKSINNSLEIVQAEFELEALKEKIREQDRLITKIDTIGELHV